MRRTFSPLRLAVVGLILVISGLVRWAVLASPPPAGPTLEFTEAEYFVGESGGTIKLTVKLSEPCSETVTVQYSAKGYDAEASEENKTKYGTAAFGSDFKAVMDENPVAGSLTLAPWETEATIEIAIVNNTTSEPLEWATVILSNPQNAELGALKESKIKIIDDDRDMPKVKLEKDSYPAAENCGWLKVKVVMSEMAWEQVTVNFTTSDGPLPNGAKAGEDYTAITPVDGSVTFKLGETAKEIEIWIIDDTTPEAAETFRLTLTSVSYGASPDSPGEAVVTIDSDDPWPSDPPPVNVYAENGQFHAVSELELNAEVGARAERSVDGIPIDAIPSWDWNGALKVQYFDAVTNTWIDATGHSAETEEMAADPEFDDFFFFGRRRLLLCPGPVLGGQIRVISNCEIRFLGVPPVVKGSCQPEANTSLPKDKDLRDTFQGWLGDVLGGRDNWPKVEGRYKATDSTLVPTVKNDIFVGHGGLKQYFAPGADPTKGFLANSPKGEPVGPEPFFVKKTDLAAIAGYYDFTFFDAKEGKYDKNTLTHARYSYIYQKDGGKWKIRHHHSSYLPEKRTWVKEGDSQYKDADPGSPDKKDIDKETQKWVTALKDNMEQHVKSLYKDDAETNALTLLKNEFHKSRDKVIAYYADKNFLGEDRKITEVAIEKEVLYGDTEIGFSVGIFSFKEAGTKYKARFTFVFLKESEAWKIIHHHMSRLPEGSKLEEVKDVEAK